MTVINRLASSLNRRDEVPNQELAAAIVKSNDKKAVKELVDNLGNKSRDIQNDCIKVLYETGEKKPALIAAYASVFTGLLKSKNNRLQWGAMTALAALTGEDPGAIVGALPEIVAAANSGSVITKDYCVNILIKLCATSAYAAKSFPLLLEQLESSPGNQLPMYAERAMPVINEKNRALFIKTLTARLKDIEKDSKRIRVEKVIKKLTGK